jgi:BASS family bile acid:Na+ symporter
VADHSRISFYIWLVSLVVVVGRTTAFVIDHSATDLVTEIALAAVAAVICVAQFALGRKIGAKYGDRVAGGQSLGQKNTVLAVWMAQSFLNPISCVAPTAYIVWQNIVNSYQIYRKK